MKTIRQTRYTKHRHTYAFDPGITITAPAVPTVKKKVDPHIINMSILSELINRHSDNRSTTVPGGLMINDVRILLHDGICQFNTTKLRYSDCYSLLMELVKERVLKMTKVQIKDIHNRLNDE